ncbi:MAG: molecular chaperone GrpE [Solirubrobacteraceae bacterium]|jgi:molecular chaperone GrpE (heat shock protein)|nr:molecular chaperone GrpE [Solirubrobacteraceae bacterium]
MSESDSPASVAVDVVEPAAGSQLPSDTAAEPFAADEHGATPGADDAGGEQQPAAETATEPAAAPEEQATAEPERDPVLIALERLDERLEESQRLLARQSEIATSLHAENQRLKGGELVRAQLPLVRDIIRVQDDLGRVLEAAGESTAAADLEMARDSILDALARNGIEPSHVAADDPLDPRRHKVVGIVAADDPAADRTIAAVVKVGFSWDDGTLIRATDVRVYKHMPPPPPAASTDPEPSAAADDDHT